MFKKEPCHCYNKCKGKNQQKNKEGLILNKCAHCKPAKERIMKAK